MRSFLSPCGRTEQSRQRADRLQPTDGAGRHPRRPHVQTHLRDEAAGAKAVEEEEKPNFDLRQFVDCAQSFAGAAGGDRPAGCVI